MTTYAALDVSLEQTAVCVIDDAGHVVMERIVVCHPDDIGKCVAGLAGTISRVGPQTGPLAPWRGLSLYEAAKVMMTRCRAANWLKTSALGIAQRRGARKAKVALARRLAVVLHRMWIDGTDFSMERPGPMTA